MPDPSEPEAAHGALPSAAPPRVLHLLSNWKWTGPAEPALNACRAQREAGWDARFACGRPVVLEASVLYRARERGLEPILPALWLSKHRRLLRGLLDARRLSRYLHDHPVDILHAHLPNALALALRAAQGRPSVRVCATLYDGERAPTARWERRLLRRTDAVLCAARTVLSDLTDGLGYPRERAFHAETSIDLARFDPERGPASGRALLGVEPDAPYVVGIVARMQRHRRFELLLDAIERAARALPGLRVVVIGRGTHQDEVAKDPVRERGLDNVVRFPGYLAGENYLAALAALDAKVFLVPGSDGSCRATREALAMGVPVIATRRGMLPEIVRHEETGLLVEETAESLALAILRLGEDRSLRARLGAEARADARARFSFAASVARHDLAYRAALARAPLGR